MSQRCPSVYTFVRRCVRKWLDDGAFELAAALAYYTLFSLAPMLLLAMIVTARVFGEDAARGQIARHLERLAGPQGAEVVESMIEGTHKSSDSGWAAMFSMAVLLFGATGAFSEVKTALNRVWGVPKRQSKIGPWQWVQRRLLALVLVLTVGLLLLALTLASMAVCAAIRFVPDIGGSSKVLLLAFEVLLSMCVAAVLFALMYRLLPDRVIAARDVLVGALVTAGLFELGILGIGAYMARSTVASAHGAAGSVIVILLGIYYSALIFLLGAEFTHVYATSAESRPVELRPRTAQGVSGMPAGPVGLNSGVRERISPAEPPPTRSWARVGIATAASLALGALAFRVRLASHR